MIIMFGFFAGFICGVLIAFTVLYQTIIAPEKKLLKEEILKTREILDDVDELRNKHTRMIRDFESKIEKFDNKTNEMLEDIECVKSTSVRKPIHWRFEWTKKTTRWSPPNGPEQTEEDSEDSSDD